MREWFELIRGIIKGELEAEQLPQAKEKIKAFAVKLGMKLLPIVAAVGIVSIRTAPEQGETLPDETVNLTEQAMAIWEQQSGTPTYVNGNNSGETNLPEGDAQMYLHYITTIDNGLSQIKEQQEGMEVYRGEIHPIYLYTPYDRATGINPTTEERLLGRYEAYLSDGEIYGIYAGFYGLEQQEYQYYNLDNIRYFTSSLPVLREQNIPRYLMNEDILRYYNYDYYNAVWPDSNYLSAWELPAGNFPQISEFCEINGNIYLIDRERRLFCPVTETYFPLPVYVCRWFQTLEERTQCQLNKNEEMLLHVQELIPEEYGLLSGYGIANYDLNEDGYDDYVLALYPVEDNEDDAGNTGVTEEYASSELWLYLSSGDGTYERTCLAQDLECQDVSLVLTDMNFTGKNTLEMEYFTGTSPYENRVYEYTYEAEDNMFCLTNYVFRGYDAVLGDVCLIYDESAIGRFTMEQYYTLAENGVSGIDITPCYRDGEPAEALTTQLQETEAQIRAEMQTGNGDEVTIRSNDIFRNTRCYSLVYYVNFEFYIPVLVDLTTEEIIAIRDCISKTELSEVCQKGCLSFPNQEPADTETVQYVRERIASLSWDMVNVPGGEVIMYLTQDGLVIWFYDTHDAFLVPREFLNETALGQYYVSQ